MTNEQFKYRVDRLCASLHPSMRVHSKTGEISILLNYSVQKLFEPCRMGEGAIGDTNIKFGVIDMLKDLRCKLDTVIKELQE